MGEQNLLFRGLNGHVYPGHSAKKKITILVYNNYYYAPFRAVVGTLGYLLI